MISRLMTCHYRFIERQWLKLGKQAAGFRQIAERYVITDRFKLVPECLNDRMLVSYLNGVR